jgi:hypothetical protein
MAKAKGGFKLEDLKKHYFWGVLPLLVVLALVFAFLAKGKIKKDYIEITEAITAAKKGVDDVASNSKHPNDDTIKAIKSETQILSDNVFASWELMYRDQKIRNRWPRQLSREFLDLVENQLKFRDPIGVGKPYLLEDYGFFIANHLPDMLVGMNRRRCQVKEYKLLKKNEMSFLGVQGLQEQFWPVYIGTDADGNSFTYVAVYSDPENPKSPVRDVFLYDVKKDLVTNFKDSQLRDEIKAVAEPEPYYRDVDPLIMDPRTHIMFGVNDSQLQSIYQAISTAAMGGAAGMMGGSGGMMGGGVSGGGARGAMGGSGGGVSGGGMMGGGMMGGGMSSGPGAIPGDGYDPAVLQTAGTSLEQLGAGATGMTGGMGGAGGMGGMGGARPTGGVGGVSGGVGGGFGSGGLGGSGGMGGNFVEPPEWSQRVYPGLPSYKERRRIVGNVDWLDPEIYGLPTWGQTASPTSIEVWYAQETLWVYEALLRVVAATNSANEEYVDNISRAPVKCIEQLLIGQNAAIEFTTLSQTIGDLTGASATSMMGGLSGGSGDMMASGSGAAGGAASGAMGSGAMGGAGMEFLSGSAEEQALQKLIIGRYVGDKDDKKDQPLMADDKPPFAEFNKMPICLKVIIDQRKIPELLASCANSTMPIDVRHLRICPDNNIPFVMPVESQAGADGMGMMGMMGGMMGGSGGMMGGSGGMGGGVSGGGAMGGSGSMAGGARGARGAMGGAGGMSGMGGMGGMGGTGDMAGGMGGGMGGVEIGRSELSQSEYGADAIRVEIYGVINIYNEPNEANFATGASAEEADAEAQSIIDSAQEDQTAEDAEEGAEEDAAATDEGATTEPTAPAQPAPAGDATPAGAAAPASAT